MALVFNQRSIDVKYLAGVLIPLMLVSPYAGAHAFPEKAIPGAQKILDSSPPSIRVWFNSELEPDLSSLVVTNAKGERVSTANSTVDTKDPTLLTLALPPLPPLPPGEYEVHWQVVGHDGHLTQGFYVFTISPGKK